MSSCVRIVMSINLMPFGSRSSIVANNLHCSYPLRLRLKVAAPRTCVRITQQFGGHTGIRLATTYYSGE